MIDPSRTGSFLSPNILLKSHLLREVFPDHPKVVPLFSQQPPSYHHFIIFIDLSLSKSSYLFFYVFDTYNITQ